MKPLRVGIDARVIQGESGGVQQFILGLVHGLDSLDEEGDRYLILTYHGHDEWLRQYSSDRFEFAPRPYPKDVVIPGLRRRVVSSAPWARDIWRRLPRPAARIPQSDGIIENDHVDVMHFTTQNFFWTSIPSIYQPHDLQHVHLPQFYTDREWNERDRRYRMGCEQATIVAASSTWVKNDLLAHYGLDEHKVVVVPPAPVLTAYNVPTEQESERIRRSLQLPARYILYPAQTWPHKNHIALVKALPILGHLGLDDVHFVFSGNRSTYAKDIDREVERLGVQDRVHFTGFVSSTELQALYRYATAVVVPTRFEAASFPIWEAFKARVPVACSNVTSLPKQVGDAAILFDPEDISSIAKSVETLWTDDDLRSALIERGTANVERFSWKNTARMFRTYYRQVAGQPLSNRDKALLSVEPLL